MCDADVAAFIKEADTTGDGMLNMAELKRYFAMHLPGASMGLMGYMKVSCPSIMALVLGNLPACW